jgi:hypothetical protein
LLSGFSACDGRPGTIAGTLSLFRATHPPRPVRHTGTASSQVRIDKMRCPGRVSR